MEIKWSGELYFNAVQILTFLLVIRSSYGSVYQKASLRKFPKNFAFGAATAAYQIEGGWNASDKGESIWDRMTHTNPSAVANEDNGDTACDSYNQYQRDVQMLEELGVDYYRFSISWSRILPSGFADKISQDGLDYYNNLINALIDKRIEPVVTIYHWDLPQPLQDLGGWPNELIADYYEDYARVLFERFGDRVKMWITFNEPSQVCYGGYGQAYMAPLLNMSGIADYMCVYTLLNSHARAYRLYEKEFKAIQKGSVGITLDSYWAEPKTSSKEDREAADRYTQFSFGIFAHPIFSKTGDYPKVVKERIAKRSKEQGFHHSRLPELSVHQVKRLQGSADFLGLNHYSSKLISHTGRIPTAYDNLNPAYKDDMDVYESVDPSWEGSASSWLKVVPWGFRKILNWISKEYNNPPVIITENGFPTLGGLQDADRVRYLTSYLNAMLDGIEDGCDVRGYTVWSLMDNFEWLSGYMIRFGLYEVDFESPERTRTPRASVAVYRDVIKQHGVYRVEDRDEDSSLYDVYSPIYNAISV